MTKNNARSAINQAQTKAATQAAKPEDLVAAALAKMTPEQIAALLGDKAPKAAKPEVTDFSGLKGKLCKVVNGRKHVGDTFKVFHVTKGNAYRKPTALCEGDKLITATGEAKGDIVFINPAYFEIVGDMTAADIKRLADHQKAQQEETLYIQAKAVREDDKVIVLSYPGWAKNLFFSKGGMISIAATLPDGEKVFEVAAWKVRKECGADAVNALTAKQAELETLVNQNQ